MIIYLTAALSSTGWIAPLLNHHSLQSDEIFFFNSLLNLREQPRVTKGLVQHSAAEVNASTFRIDPNILRNPIETGSLLAEADDSIHADSVIFRNLFVLVRSSILVADLQMESAAVAQEMLLATQMGIPVIGVSPHNQFSSWLYARCSCVLHLRSVDDLVRQIKAFM